MRSKKETIGEILLEFAMIDSCLRSIYQMRTGDMPPERIAGEDLDKVFFEYINSRVNVRLDSKSKIYFDKDNGAIHLMTLLEKIRQTRNIAAHQTYDLVTGISALPESARGESIGNYVDTVDELHNDWKLYSYQFLPIFEQWNAGALDAFDLDGKQIAKV